MTCCCTDPLAAFFAIPLMLGLLAWSVFRVLCYAGALIFIPIMASTLFYDRSPWTALRWFWRTRG